MKYNLFIASMATCIILPQFIVTFCINVSFILSIRTLFPSSSKATHTLHPCVCPKFWENTHTSQSSFGSSVRPSLSSSSLIWPSLQLRSRRPKQHTTPMLPNAKSREVGGIGSRTNMTAENTNVNLATSSKGTYDSSARNEDRNRDWPMPVVVLAMVWNFLVLRIEVCV